MKPGFRLLGRRVSFRVVAWAAMIGIVVGAAVGILVPAGAGWDFANFYDTGHRVVAAELGDIYHPDRLIGGQEPQGAMRFWGPPISAFLYAPLAMLSAGQALVAFKVQNTLALAASLVLLFLAFRRLVPSDRGSRDRFFAAFCLAALLYQPFWTVYRVGGQTTPTALLLSVLAFLAYRSDRTALAATLLVVAALIKPFLAPALLLLAFLGDRRYRMGLVLTGTVVAVVSLAWLGWPLHREFLSVAAEGLGKASPWYYNSALTVPVGTLARTAAGDLASGWPVTLGEALSVALRLLAVAACIGAVRPWRKIAGTDAGWLRRQADFLVALVLAVCASSVVWEHYLAFLFPVLGLFIARSPELPRRAKLVLVAVLVLSLGQNLILALAVRDAVAGFPASIDVLMAVLKAAPLWLTVYLTWRFRSVFATSGSPLTGEAARLAQVTSGV